MNKQKDFVYTIGERIIDNYRNLEIIDVKQENDIIYYNICCHQCGFDGQQHIPIYRNKSKQIKEKFWISQTSLKDGVGCPCCGKKQMVVVRNINDLYTTHPHIANLLVNKDDGFKYTYGSIDKVKIKCPYCESEFLKSITKLTSRGFRCTVCGDNIPIGEKIIYNFLLFYTDDVEKEKVFEWNPSKRYDFYSKKHNLICEVFGSQHYRPEFERIHHLNIRRTYLEEQENDINKESVAKENGIGHYIIINSSSANLDIIKNNIINSEFVNIFDLSICDWNVILKKSLKSNIIKTCELFNQGITSTNILGELIGVNRTTIVNYLKQGSVIGLCDYQPSHYNENAVKSANKARMRKVICVTNGLIFESCAEAKRYYNVNVDISSYCNGKKKIMTTSDGQKLQWMYYDDYINRLIDK